MNNNILRKAHECWLRCDTLRRRRQRYKQYTYGDQWCDMVEDESGNRVREDALIRSRGGRPHINNLIRRLVKSIVGRYRATTADSGYYSRGALAPVFSANQLSELDARLLEEFLISGCAIQRVAPPRGLGAVPAGTDLRVRVDNVSPARFFADVLDDPRGWDVRMVGVLHSLTTAEVVALLAPGDPERAAAIRDVYASMPSADSYTALPYGACRDTGAPCDPTALGDFYNAPDGMQRLIEVWTLDTVDTIMCHDPLTRSYSQVSYDGIDSILNANEMRRHQGKPPIEYTGDNVARWQCRWYAPNGTLLALEQSPYADGRHPFAFKFYPLTDGEVHPFVEDTIDQQRYINRLVTLIDHIIGTSAKGVLLFPQSQRPNDVSWEDITRKWSACDGVIPITGRSEHLPTQVVSNGADAGAHQLLALELKLFDDASGVSGALLGKDAQSGTGASLYSQLTRNSVIALDDIYQTFEALTSRRDAMIRALHP